MCQVCYELWGIEQETETDPLPLGHTHSNHDKQIYLCDRLGRETKQVQETGCNKVKGHLHVVRGSLSDLIW
jgi:hypothetical protein